MAAEKEQHHLELPSGAGLGLSSSLSRGPCNVRLSLIRKIPEEKVHHLLVGGLSAYRRRIIAPTPSRVYGVLWANRIDDRSPLFLLISSLCSPRTLPRPPPFRRHRSVPPNEPPFISPRVGVHLLSVLARATRRCSAYFEYIRKDTRAPVSARCRAAGLPFFLLSPPPLIPLVIDCVLGGPLPPRPEERDGIWMPGMLT